MLFSQKIIEIKRVLHEEAPGLMLSNVQHYLANMIRNRFPTWTKDTLLLYQHR